MITKAVWLQTMSFSQKLLMGRKPKISPFMGQIPPLPCSRVENDRLRK